METFYVKDLSNLREISLTTPNVTYFSNVAHQTVVHNTRDTLMIIDKPSMTNAFAVSSCYTPHSFTDENRIWFCGQNKYATRLALKCKQK